MGQRVGRLNTVKKDAGSPRAADGVATSLVAKEERNQVLIMEWRCLRGRGSGAVRWRRAAEAGGHHLDADEVAVAIRSAEGGFGFENRLHQAGQCRIDARSEERRVGKEWRE